MLRGIHLEERDGTDSCQQENTIQHGVPQASPQPGNASSMKSPRHLLYPHHAQMSKRAGDIRFPTLQVWREQTGQQNSPPWP